MLRLPLAWSPTWQIDLLLRVCLRHCRLWPSPLAVLSEADSSRLRSSPRRDCVTWTFVQEAYIREAREGASHISKALPRML
ncbi:uncharacterized protein L969DRAFT_54918 [Mixia osmundae IAM 14324]|uniref:Uncharacterized protein n=1 Tax=Mixia osmundae (strain CBS 9802 / IAM 14324 / JCM 22182 / KY 12970) TaxID=764103 RepID=G7DW94_MIXOS|nr:uncharacterized protein L969DRAFT_54918 [Mixia osmundae IAM 14324]KEI36519.1 hypothetical protein L969DRAFT_54918 [Mixia osmundae IAM 14324]GAA94782.1 hypothetical protein E5Q_01436 [Mixia osmundae IAM 14324]